MNKELKQSIETAVDALKRGEVIAYPTEGVFGLGCDPTNANAIAELLQLKNRSLSKGFILVADHWEQLEKFVDPVPPQALYQALETWPGPVTWLFPASDEAPEWLRGDHRTLAIRVSDHPVVRALCRRFKGPITSTSANLSGELPIKDYKTTQLLFGNRVSVIVDAPVGGLEKPTQIRDVITGEIVRS